MYAQSQPVAPQGDQEQQHAGALLGARALVLSVLGLSLIARVTDANPHATYWYMPFVAALFVLPIWYATGRGRELWTRYGAALLAVQGILTYVPFAVFGSAWVGGVSGLLGALVLLTIAPPVRWLVFAALAGLELALWLVVGLPYDPAPDASFWVLNAFVNTGLSVFAVTRLADLLDTLMATRHRLVTAAVMRQRLAATDQLQERIVDRLADLTGHAGAVVRSPDTETVRAGLAATGRLARAAAADARRLLLALPDPAHDARQATDDADPTAGTPRLARTVATVVVVLFAVQYLVNVGVIDGQPRPGIGTVILFLAVAVTVVVIQLRHLRLHDQRDRPAGWPWTLGLLAVLSFAAYPSVGAPSLIFLAFLAASGLILIRHWSRWALFGVTVASLPVLTLASPGATLSGLRAQALWAVYAGAIEAVAGLMIYGLYGFTRASSALQAAQREAAGAAGTQEQLRLAHDAHDALGLGLSTIALKSDLALGLLDADPELARRETVQIMHLSTIVAHDALAVGTGSLSLDLASELASARDTLDAAGISGRISTPELPLPAETSAVLAAVLREAVTNVLRHSGARTCAITVSGSEARVLLEVTNDGSNTAASGTLGLGLHSMSERLRPLGGSLHTKQVGEVHTLTVDIPTALGASALAVHR